MLCHAKGRVSTTRPFCVVSGRKVGSALRAVVVETGGMLLERAVQGQEQALGRGRGHDDAPVQVHGQDVFSTAVLGVQAFGLTQAAAEDDLLRRAAGLEDIGVGRAEARAVQGHADLLAFAGSGGFGPGLAGIFLCAHAYFLFAPGAAL